MKTRRAAARLAAQALTLALFLSGCAARTDGNGADPKGAAGLSERTVFAMDTVIDMKIYGPEELLGEAETILRESEERLSVTDEQSEVYALNAGETVALSPSTANTVGRALERCEMTEGALDISIYPAVRAWGFTTDEQRVPSDAELGDILTRVDWRKLKEAYGGALEDADTPSDPDADEQLLLTLPEGMEIDLGAVAKGEAGQEIADMLKAQGVSSAIINLGGNVQTVGVKPDGSPWRVAVQDPFGDGLMLVTEIDDKSVITSGGYERFFEKDGQLYWHIIDPSTGRPADSGLVSVTIVGDDGMLCDALSTACFIMGLDRSEELWRQLGSFEAVFVSSEGDVYVTEGLEKNTELVESYAGKEFIVIRR